MQGHASFARGVPVPLSLRRPPCRSELAHAQLAMTGIASVQHSQ
jgi:hypothetical protein